MSERPGVHELLLAEDPDIMARVGFPPHSRQKLLPACRNDNSENGVTEHDADTGSTIEFLN